MTTCDRCELSHKPAPSAERVYCKCGKTYAGGSVVTDPPVTDEHGQHSVVRRVYCDHCRHVMVWCESADGSGKPTGAVISGPGVYRGRKAVRRFLARHPQATGVLQT